MIRLSQSVLDPRDRRPLRGRWARGPALVALVALVTGLGPAAASAQTTMAALVDTQSFHPRARWVSRVDTDARAELLIKVNVVRIYSSTRTAEQIAPRNWIYTQLEIANRLFRLPDADMRTYGSSRLAPIIQVQLNRILDVHQDKATKLLGVKVDTENMLSGDARTLNGETLANTWDLRSLKVTGETHIMTIYCVWDAKDSTSPSTVYSFGGESNVGFADQAPEGPPDVLTVVTGVRARMGVVVTRQPTAWMNAYAHEMGHYFGLSHAWDRTMNQKMGIQDLGTGPQGQVDERKEFANVMDYDNGTGVKQYFSRQQLRKMYDFARDRASTQIHVERRKPGAAPARASAPVPARVSAPATLPTVSSGKVRVLMVESSTPGGPVKVRVEYEIEDMVSEQGLVVAWFNDAQGQRLMDADGQYRTTAGHIAVGWAFRPKGRAASEADRTLELPAGQLHLEPGRHTLSVDVGLFEAGRQVARADRETFEYVVAPQPPKETPGEAPRAWINKAVVNPREIIAGKPYVTITSALTLDHLKGAEVRLEARFAFASGKTLKDLDQAFAAPDGVVMISSKIVPLYARTRIPSLVMRIPHTQLHLAADLTASLVASLVIRRGDKTLASEVTPQFVVQTGTAAASPAKGARQGITATATIERVTLKEYGEQASQPVFAVSGQLRLVGYRGKKVQFLVWCTDGQNRPLLGVDPAYRSRTGQLGSSITLVPRYDSAVFPGAEVYIPYGQLQLPQGKHRILVYTALSSGGHRLTQVSPPMVLDLQIVKSYSPKLL